MSEVRTKYRKHQIVNTADKPTHKHKNQTSLLSNISENELDITSQRLTRLFLKLTNEIEELSFEGIRTLFTR